MFIPDSIVRQFSPSSADFIRATRVKSKVNSKKMLTAFANKQGRSLGSAALMSWLKATYPMEHQACECQAAATATTPAGIERWYLGLMTMRLGILAEEKLKLKQAKLARKGPAKKSRRPTSSPVPAPAVFVPTTEVDPRTDAFLRSYEWRRVRYAVLKRDGSICACCRTTEGVMNVDHIKPRRLFPQLALDMNNLQVLCEACNHGKGNWDQTDWRVPAPLRLVK